MGRIFRRVGKTFSSCGKDFPTGCSGSSKNRPPLEFMLASLLKEIRVLFYLCFCLGLCGTFLASFVAKQRVSLVPREENEISCLF